MFIWPSEEVVGKLLEGMLKLVGINDQTMHVQSFDPVTRYEPQLSKATHVMTSVYGMKVKKQQ